MTRKPAAFAPLSIENFAKHLRPETSAVFCHADSISESAYECKYVCSMDSGQSFSEWFRHQLTRREWSQRDFARRSDLAPSTVSEWYRGTRLPDPESCLKIADALNIDPDLVLVMAGHRPNIENLKPDDPRTDLIALVRRVRWTPEREAIARAVLESMITAERTKGIKRE